MDLRLPPAGPAGGSRSDRAAAPAHALHLRELLADFMARSAAGRLPVRVGQAGDLSSRGEGHFHLAPELFLQVSGWTQFRFPHAELTLAPGEALVLPPKLLHAERVRAGGAEAPFCNVVIYADGPALSCHLAHEARPGKPGILHLEACHHPQAARIHDWLSDAARLAQPASPAHARDASDVSRAAAQVRALVSAATAGVLRALDDADPAAASEPALVARLRVLVKNQLADHRLSVRGLAQQSGCTADYLSHRFSQLTGERLVAYITRLRMERAARLLRESTMAGKEVAWACGFATQSYFIRSFRAHHGVTPKDWRAGHDVPD